jgi:hypothetical protein
MGCGQQGRLKIKIGEAARVLAKKRKDFSLRGFSTIP